MKLCISQVFMVFPTIFAETRYWLFYFIDFIIHCSFYFYEFNYPVEGSWVTIHGYLDSFVLIYVFDYVCKMRYSIIFLNPSSVQKYLFWFLVAVGPFFDQDFDIFEIKGLAWVLGALWVLVFYPRHQRFHGLIWRYSLRRRSVGHLIFYFYTISLFHQVF